MQAVDIPSALEMRDVCVSKGLNVELEVSAFRKSRYFIFFQLALIANSMERLFDSENAYSTV